MFYLIDFISYLKCIFSVLYCPRLYNNNYMTVTCPSGNQNGAQCSFSCRNGSELIGQNVTTCEMSKNRQYADWDFKGGNPPYCEGRNNKIC